MRLGGQLCLSRLALCLGGLPFFFGPTLCLGGLPLWFGPALCLGVLPLCFGLALRLGDLPFLFGLALRFGGLALSFGLALRLGDLPFLYSLALRFGGLPFFFGPALSLGAVLFELLYQFGHIGVKRGVMDAESISQWKLFEIHWQLISLGNPSALEQDWDHWDVALQRRRDFDTYEVIRIIQSASSVLITRV